MIKKKYGINFSERVFAPLWNFSSQASTINTSLNILFLHAAPEQPSNFAFLMVFSAQRSKHFYNLSPKQHGQICPRNFLHSGTNFCLGCYDKALVKHIWRKTEFIWLLGYSSSLREIWQRCSQWFVLNNVHYLLWCRNSPQYLTHTYVQDHSTAIPM